MTKIVAAGSKRAKSMESATTTADKLPAAAKALRARPPAASKKASTARAAAAAAHEQLLPAEKAKLVRDSFTIPKPEYEKLADLKRRALALGIAAKKSELLRAGIAAMNAMSDRAFLAAVKSVPSLKTGRPKAVSTSSHGS